MQKGATFDDVGRALLQARILRRARSQGAHPGKTDMQLAELSYRAALSLDFVASRDLPGRGWHAADAKMALPRLDLRWATGPAPEPLTRQERDVFLAAH